MSYSISDKGHKFVIHCLFQRKTYGNYNCYVEKWEERQNKIWQHNQSQRLLCSYVDEPKVCFLCRFLSAIFASWVNIFATYELVFSLLPLLSEQCSLTLSLQWLNTGFSTVPHRFLCGSNKTKVKVSWATSAVLWKRPKFASCAASCRQFLQVAWTIVHFCNLQVGIFAFVLPYLHFPCNDWILGFQVSFRGSGSDIFAIPLLSYKHLLIIQRFVRALNT